LRTRDGWTVGGRRAAPGKPERRHAMPGRGGLRRLASSTLNSLRGLREGLGTEPAIRQEAAVLALGLPLSFLVAASLWTWVALVASLLMLLVVEFMNTALERLCDHVTPERHEAIRVTKDLASASVLFAVVTAALVWGAALVERLGLLA